MSVFNPSRFIWEDTERLVRFDEQPTIHFIKSREKHQDFKMGKRLRFPPIDHDDDRSDKGTIQKKLKAEFTTEWKTICGLWISPGNIKKD